MDDIICKLKTWISDNVYDLENDEFTKLKEIVSDLRSIKYGGCSNNNNDIIKSIDTLNSKMSEISDKINNISKPDNKLPQDHPILSRFKFTGNKKDYITCQQIRQIVNEYNCKYSKNLPPSDGLNDRGNKRGFYGIKLF